MEWGQVGSVDEEWMYFKEVVKGSTRERHVG